MHTEPNELIGQRVNLITFNANDEVLLLLFNTSSYKEKIYKISHYPECCEVVKIISVEGNIPAILGNKITECTIDYKDISEGATSATLTTIVIKTSDGELKIVYRGESNGYYGETACLEEIT